MRWGARRTNAIQRIADVATGMSGGDAHLMIQAAREHGAEGHVWVVWQAGWWYNRVLVGQNGRCTGVSPTARAVTGDAAIRQTVPRPDCFTAPEWWAHLTGEP
jgi:hypothetical protein